MRTRQKQITRITGAKDFHALRLSSLKCSKNVTSCDGVDMAISKSQATQDLEWAVGLNRLSLQLFGTGTDTERDWRSSVSKPRIAVIFILILIVLLIPQAMALVRVSGHLYLVIENLITSLLFLVSEFELVMLWLKNEVISMMMEYIRCDWMRAKTEQERETMLRYGKLSRIITIGGYLIMAIAIAFYYTPVVFGFVMRTLTNLTDVGDRPFSLQTFYLFDVYTSPIYELVIISHIVIGTISGFCYTTVGTLFGVIVLHVSAQLENLYYRLEMMGKSDNDNVSNFKIEFKCNIEEHERLIRFSKMIESTFSMVLLEVVAGFTLLLCLQGYQIIVILQDDDERPTIQVIFFISYTMYVIFIMFLYSAVGDTLVTQSERIQYATYNCEWYKLKPQEAAQCIPLLVCSQRPLMITAGKFVSLNLPTFATLLKTTAGYVSFLLAVRD